MASSREATVESCYHCGAIVVGYTPGEPCPGCGGVIYE